MKRSRTTSASEAGRYVHLGIAGILALLSVNHLVALPFLLLEMGYLWKTARRLAVGALFVVAILLLRYRIVATAPAFQDPVFEGVVTSVEDDRCTIRTAGVKVLVYHDGSFEVEPGDVVNVVARVMTSEPRSVEHGFDYGRYLLSEGIRGSVFATDLEVVGHTFDVGMIAFELRRVAEAQFDGEALAMIRLFALGDATALPAELSTPSRDLGIFHLFAVSGMHVGAIALFLEALFRRMHLRQGVQAVFIGVALGFFTLVTGCAVSIVRAVAMYLAVAVSRLFKLPFSATDAIAFVALFVLAVNPFALDTAGFRLSYLVAFAIVLGSDLLRDADLVRKTLKIGLLANAVALPILLELNGSFHLAGIPANLVFVLFVDRLAVPAAFFVFFVPAAEPLLDVIGVGFFEAIAAVGTIDLSIDVNFSSDLAKAAYWIILGVALVRLSS
ncbi:MAG: ComEC/Rec2 family competence protein, partial [Bacillota bacterium]|nr:ComEC/Rec2 family competence protein [Bacillota bacterium]